MRRLYSVFFHYLHTLAPEASGPRVSEGSFHAFACALYFPLTWLVDLFEWWLDCSIGTYGTMGVWLAVWLGLYRVLLARNQWQNIILRYPLKPVSKAQVLLRSALLVVLGVCIVLFPLGRKLRGLSW